MEKFEELASLQSQVKGVRLQDKLGKQNFHEDLKKLYEPLTDTIKNTSENITQTISETSTENNKAISDLNKKVLELLNEKGLIAQYLVSFLVNLFTPENKSQFRLTKDHNSIEKYDFLINNGIPVTLYSNMLTFRDSHRSFNLDGDLLETITNYVFNVDHSQQQDRKLIYESGKEIKFDIKQKRTKK